MDLLHPYLTELRRKNIETTRDGYLEDLNRLRVVKYNWNDQEDGTPKDLGLDCSRS